MVGVTGAIIGSAVLGAAGSAIGGSQNSKAIKNSAQASLQAQREANASAEKIASQQINAYKDALNTSTGLQTNMYNSSGQMGADIYNQRQQILQPWAAGGGAAFNQINSMLGLPQQSFRAPQQIAFTPITAPAPAPAPGAPAPTTPGAVPPAGVVPPNQQNNMAVARVIQGVFR